MSRANHDMEKLVRRLRFLESENLTLKEYKDLAHSQTQQIEDLSKSIENLNAVNDKINQEWRKTISKMKQAREEMDLIVDLMGKMHEENTQLKRKLEDQYQ